MRIPINQILKLMERPENVRNVGVLAHVDHGKTTLSDVILAEAGYISSELAGRLLYLDYLEEERKRGITIKTSAISLVMKSNDKNYLLNLVDTPGHVDFSGKVSRVLRLIDGALIVVDAVEGVMAQTEAVIRQIVEEYVKPVLFINKLDRLVNELRLNPPQIQTVLEDIIFTFNDIIKSYVDENKEYFLVNPSKEDVVLGSALYKWGFTIRTANKKGLKFKEIYDMVKSNPHGLKKILPLGSLISRIIFERLPPPTDAQKIRVPKLWINSDPPQSVLVCGKDKPTVIYVSKVQKEANRLICTSRIFSGVVTPGVYKDLSTHLSYKVNAVGILAGTGVKIVRSVPAGNVIGLVMSNAEIGSTLSDHDIKGFFKKPIYLVVPVLYVAVTPLYPRDFEKIISMLESEKIEDPNIYYEINKDTGQILLWGVGELQLELLVNKLKEKVNIYTSEPIVSFKEIPVNSIKLNKNGYMVNIEPLSKSTNASVLISKLEDMNEIILSQLPQSEREEVEALIKITLKSGPLIGEPIVGSKITIEKIDDSIDFNLNDLFNVFMEAFLKIKTRISEPYYRFEITTKADYMGSVVNEINRRGGKIEDVSSDQSNYVIIKGIIPVRKSLGLASKIREVASGNAYVQLLFYKYIIAEDKDEEEIIEEVKKRKGLV